MNYGHELKSMSQGPLKIRSFTDLDAWKEGHQLVLMTYKNTRLFPKGEQFALTAQMRRAVVSVTSNIAEGFSRNSYREKAQFYAMALGSLTEVHNQFIIAKDIGYLPHEAFADIEAQAVKVHKITNGLIKKSRSLIPDS